MFSGLHLHLQRKERWEGWEGCCFTRQFCWAYSKQGKNEESADNVGSLSLPIHCQSYVKYLPCLYFFGYFPGVWLWFADVSEHSICSIFKGWMWSMVGERRTWYLYQGRGLLELAEPMGRGHQVVGGSEWVRRCGGGRYKGRLSGCDRVIMYCMVVPFFFEYV